MQIKPIAAIGNVAAYLLMVVVNYLAVALPINNKTTGELSDQIPNLFTPAGFTFSIWGVIYLALAAFVVYQAIVLFKNADASDAVLKISPYFILSAVANASWIFAWHYQQIAWSVFIMLLILISLIVIHNKLSLALPWRPLRHKLLLDLPFSIYLGWISIATIANITALLVVNDVRPFEISEKVWTIMMLIAGTVLTLVILWTRRNIFFALVPCWAFYGIISKRMRVGDEVSLSVAAVARVCIFLMLIAILLTIIIQRINERKTEVKGPQPA